jgi:hypothetical protein
MMACMIRVLKEAIDEVAALPESDQEQIGRELLLHVEKIRALRADLQAGLVPRRSDYDWLILSQSRMGKSFGATGIWMLLATPG